MLRNIKMITDTQKQEIRGLWADLKSSGEIANHLGLTRNTVMGYIHRCKQQGLLHARANTKAKKPAVPKPVELRVKPRITYVRKPAPWLVPLLEKNKAGVSLMQLKERHCRYIIGEVRGANTRYCGQPRVGKSMCAEHHALCYITPNSKAEAKRNKTAFVLGKRADKNLETIR